MGTTTRHHLPYPAENDNNDYPYHMRLLAEVADDMAVDITGLLSERPAAGEDGRYYWATDVNGLYRDSGSPWNIICRDWKGYTPAVSVNYQGPGSPGGTPLIVANPAVNVGRYRIASGTCQVHVLLNVTLNNSAHVGPSYNISLPVPARYGSVTGAALCQNSVGHVLTNRTVRRCGWRQLDRLLQGADPELQHSQLASIPYVPPFYGVYNGFDITYEI